MCDSYVMVEYLLEYVSENFCYVAQLHVGTNPYRPSISDVLCFEPLYYSVLNRKLDVAIGILSQNS